MASEWPIVRIEDIAEKIAMGPFGSDIKTDNFVRKGVPVIRGGNLTNGRFHGEGFVFLTEEKANDLANANAFPGDLVFTHRGTLGQVGLIPKQLFPRYVVSQSQMKLVCDKSKALPEYIYYFFKSPAGQSALLANTSQTGVPAISRPVTSLKGIQLRLPPLEEQRAISETLSALDDRIDNLRQTNATLEAIAAALFKSRFVDFNGVPPGDMQESELGLIPKRWCVVQLDHAFEVNPKRELRKGVVAPYLDMASLSTTGAVPSMPVMRGFSSGTKFINGDTLLARITPCLENGKTSFVNFLQQGQVGWGSTEFIVLRPKPPLPPFFGYLLARRGDFREHAIRAMSGTSGRQRVQISQLQNFKIAIPDEATANAFADFIEPLQESLFANEEQATTLAALRDALLPRLISGKLRVTQ